jgi:hypothetical protein
LVFFRQFRVATEIGSSDHHIVALPFLAFPARNGLLCNRAKNYAGRMV